jgi:hypothetical protein
MAKKTAATKRSGTGSLSQAKNRRFAEAYGGGEKVIASANDGTTTNLRPNTGDQQQIYTANLQQFGQNSQDDTQQNVSPAQQRLAEMTKAAKNKAVSAAYELGGVLDGGLHPREQLLIPGLYFAHRPGDARWSLVIQIEGVAPFFTMVVFDRDTGLSARALNPDPANYLLGPKIDVPGFARVTSEL